MKLAVIGTGEMGSAVAERLLYGDHEVIVFNRTRGSADALKANGASVAESPEEAIRRARGIVSLVVDGRAMRETVLSPQALEAFDGRTLLKVTTTFSRDTEDASLKVREAGGQFLDVALLSVPEDVRAGRVQALVGSSVEDFDLWAKVLKVLGPKIIHIGPVGTASAAENALLQIMMFQVVAFANSLAIFDRAKLPVDVLVDVVKSNPVFGMPPCDYFRSRMAPRDYEPPLYRLEKHVKDVSLSLQEMERYDVDATALRGLHAFFKLGMDKGLDDEDYTAVYDLINPRTGRRS